MIYTYTCTYTSIVDIAARILVILIVILLFGGFWLEFVSGTTLSVKTRKVVYTAILIAFVVDICTLIVLPR